MSEAIATSSSAFSIASIREMVIRWYPPMVLMVMIFMASSLPARGALGAMAGGDKVLHGVGYGVLAVLVCRSLYTDRPSLWVALGGLVIAAAYGLSDEYHQSFVPSRMGSLMDAIADMCGAAAGAGAWLLHRRWRS